MAKEQEQLKINGPSQVIEEPHVVRISDDEFAKLMLAEKKVDEAYKKKSLGNCQNFCGHF